jgi:hypothetical protein
MNNLKETAEVYRLGLLIGFFTVSDAVLWADSIISSEKKPHIAIINIAMSRNEHPEDIARQLDALPGKFDSKVVSRQLVRLMSEKLTQDEKQAHHIAHCLYQMVLYDMSPGPEAERSMRYFDDALDLASQGIHGNPAKIIEELKVFLQKSS